MNLSFLIQRCWKAINHTPHTYLNIIPPSNWSLKANKLWQLVTELCLQINFKQVNSVTFWMMVPLCRCLPGYISNRIDSLGFSPVFVDSYQTSSKPRPQVECYKFLQHVRARINISSHYELALRLFPCSHWTKYCVCKYLIRAAQTASLRNFIIRQYDILTAWMHFTTMYIRSEGGRMATYVVEAAAVAVV